MRGLRWVILRDHPRVGGEKKVKFGSGTDVVGSPPRRRGKGLLGGGLAGLGGITPAWAGKSFPDYSKRCSAWDHPRMGGEKGSYRWVIKSVKGSPPRRRGKGAVNQCFDQALRITPAWAGKRGWAVR